MQINPPLRKGLRRLLTLALLTPLAMSLAWAQPASVAATTTTTSPAKPAVPAAKGTKTKAASAPSVAETEGTKITKLPTIVVTAATGTTQPVDTTATTTTVLSRQTLDDQKYATLPDAIRSVPGLSVVTSGMPGAQTSVFVHGLDSRDTLVTIDGRRQPPGLSGANDNFANLTLDNVDQVEVVRTPVSSSNGGSAMGGVINLVTLSGKGVTQPEGSVSFEAGSFQTYRENAQSRGAVGNFDYAVSLSRQDSVYPALNTGLADFFTTGFAGQADQYRNTGYRGNFGYQVSPEVYVDVHTTYNNAYTSSPGQYVIPNPTANLTTEQWSVSPEVTAKVTDFYTTKLYYTRNQLRLDSQDPFDVQLYESFFLVPQNLRTRTQINTDSVDWQNNFQVARNWSLSAGVQGDDSGYYIYDDALNMQTLQGDRRNIGGFISSQWEPLPGLNVFSSGRFDSYNQFAGAFSWRQGVSYLIAPTRTQLHASVARAFTPPPLQDISYPGGINNPDLKPETSLGWEAGVAQPFFDGKVTPSVTYFHNHLNNYIEAYAPAYVPMNIPDATTEGVEVGLDLKPIDTVAVHFGYTYLNAVDNTAHVRLLRRPRNQLDFTGTWKPVPQLTLGLGGDWVVDRQDIDPTSSAFPPPQITAPDYFVLRASATYQINDNVSIWVRGENLTDRNYQPALGYYAASMAGYGGIKVSF
jgi:vitamin B12 transporter